MNFDQVRFLLFIGLIISFANSGLAQQPDTEQQFTYEKREIWFDKLVSLENTSLINGPQYFIPFKGPYTHLFFGSGELTREQVKYDHQRFENISLLYDVLSNILVLCLRHNNGPMIMIQMDKSRVESFTLYNHNFKTLVNSYEPELGPNYYDILYEGKNIMLVARREKSKKVSNGRIEFQLEEKFYLIRNNQWSRLTGVSSYYELMKTSKPRIVDFIKSRKIKVRKQNEQEMIDIATFCDSIEKTVAN